jgi:hypothetical protein
VCPKRQLLTPLPGLAQWYRQRQHPKSSMSPFRSCRILFRIHHGILFRIHHLNLHHHKNVWNRFLRLSKRIKFRVKIRRLRNFLRIFRGTHLNKILSSTLKTNRDQPRHCSRISPPSRLRNARNEAGSGRRTGIPKSMAYVSYSSWVAERKPRSAVRAILSRSIER